MDALLLCSFSCCNTLFCLLFTFSCNKTRLNLLWVFLITLSETHTHTLTITNCFPVGIFSSFVSSDALSVRHVGRYYELAELPLTLLRFYGILLIATLLVRSCDMQRTEMFIYNFRSFLCLRTFDALVYLLELLHTRKLFSPLSVWEPCKRHLICVTNQMALWTTILETESRGCICAKITSFKSAHCI